MSEITNETLLLVPLHVLSSCSTKLLFRPCFAYSRRVGGYSHWQILKMAHTEPPASIFQLCSHAETGLSLGTRWFSPPALGGYPFLPDWIWQRPLGGINFHATGTKGSMKVGRQAHKELHICLKNSMTKQFCCWSKMNHQDVMR